MLERYYNSRDIAVLKGKTITSVEGLEDGGKEVKFFCDDGTAYKMFHQQDNDEIVFICKNGRIECYSPYDAPGAFSEDEESDNAIAIELHAKKVLAAIVGSPVIFAERIVLDREILKGGTDKGPHNDPIGMQKTLFLIATKRGAISITWNGISYDPSTSTEIDFVQIEGKGVWKEEEHTR